VRAISTGAFNGFFLHSMSSHLVCSCVVWKGYDLGMEYADPNVYQWLTLGPSMGSALFVSCAMSQGVSIVYPTAQTHSLLVDSKRSYDRWHWIGFRSC